MPKEIFRCTWCGKEVLRYRSCVGKHIFCCADCRSAFLSKSTNPSGYTKHEHLANYNKAHNRDRMTPSVRAKLRKAHLQETVKANTYKKLYGRHEHRVIAEQIIGRALRIGEVVHNIDGNKHNNSPENLMVLSSQAEHWAIHRKRGDAL